MAFAGLSQVVSHIADSDTPVFTGIAAAFAELGTAITAGTDTNTQMTFVFLEPVGDMFDIQGLVFHGDRFFDRDHMHADTGTARRDHLGNTGQRDERHPFKELCKFREFIDL